MSVRPPAGDAFSDDELLTRLGRGEPVDGGDAERMLAAWRASMPAGGPADQRLLDAVTTTLARSGRDRRRLRRLTACAAATALLTGTALTAIGAAQARPDSPLWPVTELVFTGLAESRAAVDGADHALRDARTAAAQGRIPEATRLLARADEYLAKVREPGAADRLRHDIAALRATLGRDTTDSRADVTGEAAAPAAAPAPPAPTSPGPAPRTRTGSTATGTVQGPGEDSGTRCRDGRLPDFRCAEGRHDDGDRRDWPDEPWPEAPVRTPR